MPVCSWLYRTSHFSTLGILKYYLLSSMLVDTRRFGA
jgi:hypothetical protein